MVRRSRLIAALCIATMLATSVPAVGAGAPVPILSAIENPGYARLYVRLPAPDAQEVTATGNANIVILKFAEPVSVNPSVFAEQAPSFVAAAAMSADKRSIRIALMRPARLQNSKSGALLAFDLVAPDQPSPAAVTVDADRKPNPAAKSDPGKPGAATKPGAEVIPNADEPLKNAAIPPNAPRVIVDVASGREYSRIQIRSTSPYQVTRAGDRVAVRLPGAQGYDLARLRTDPPKNVKDAARRYEGGGSFLDIALVPGAGIRHFREGGNIIVDVLPPGVPVEALPPTEAAKPPTSASTQTASNTKTPMTTDTPVGGDAAAPAITNPVPENGVVQVEVTQKGKALELQFPFAAPVAAAMFRRGDAIWILFEANAKIDAAAIPANGKPVKTVSPVLAPGVSGLRLTVSPGTRANPVALGGRWRVTLEDAAVPVGRSVAVRRETGADGIQRLDVDVSDAAGARWLSDPSVGDRIGVGFVYGPTTAVTAQRSFVEAALPPTFHGVLVTARADGVDIRPAPGRFVVGRPGGLSASMDLMEEEKPTSPAFIDFANWRAGPAADFTKNRAKLEVAAASEMGDAKSNGQKRLDLARFLLAWELPQEAMGILRTVVSDNPAMATKAEIAGLQGVALAMMGRNRSALDVLTGPSVASDPAAALWRGLANVALEDWQQARTEFDAGVTALENFAPEQRSRFQEASARAALAMGDLGMARRDGLAARLDARSDETKLRAALVLAQMAAAGGATDQALNAFKLIEAAGMRELAVRAALAAASLEADKAIVPPEKSIEAIDSLRYAWRGDALEIDILRRLGKLHLDAGRLREGLEVMRGAITLRSDLPASRRMRDDMSLLFRKLFLEGEAEKLDPFQALALFYDFSDLTPVGPDGDRLIRNLADRLVALDLLPQATELLKHQVDKRLEGFPKAQIATDLAALYMLDGKPQDALNTIQTSRVAQLPERLNAPRRLIEAAALARLGRSDHALEVMAFDKTPDGRALRTEIYWGAKQWPEAATSAMGGVPAPTAEFTPTQAADLMRSIVAYTLAGDRGAVAGIGSRYGNAMRETAFSGSFDALTGTEAPTSQQIDTVVRELGQEAGFERLLKGMRLRVAEAAEGVPTALALSPDVVTDGSATRAVASATPRRPAPRRPAAAPRSPASAQNTARPPVANSRIITGVPTAPSATPTPPPQRVASVTRPDGGSR
jgi:hypothetical protein